MTFWRTATRRFLCENLDRQCIVMPEDDRRIIMVARPTVDGYWCKQGRLVEITPFDAAAPFDGDGDLPSVARVAMSLGLPPMRVTCVMLAQNKPRLAEYDGTAWRDYRATYKHEPTATLWLPLHAFLHMVGAPCFI